MADAAREITLNVRTTRDEGPKKSSERVDELGDHLTKLAVRSKVAEKSLGGLNRKLLSTAGAATVAGRALKDVGDNGGKLERKMFKVHKTMQALGGMLQKFLVGALKLATMGLGAMGVALVGVHALFVVGKFLIKSYSVAMQGLAASAAGATVALGLVAAAMREQQAAQFAYAGKGNSEFGSGLRQAQVHMRSLQADTVLAGAGAAALNAAYGEIAKSTNGFDNRSKSILKGLGDFASAGQPLEEGLKKAAAVVVALQDKKTGFGAVTAAAKEMGPAMVKALEEAKKKGIDTKEEFIAALNEGKLSALGGVTGQMDAVNNTLIGQLKKYFNLLKVRFADFGQQFLPEAKVAFEKIYRIIDSTLAQTSGSIAGLSKSGGILNLLVSATQKVSDFYIKLIRDYLPSSMGLFSRLGAWWDKFKTGWSNVTEALRPLIDGAKVIEGAFGKAWRPIWNQVKSATMEFNRDIQRSKPGLEAFGASLGGTIAQMLKMLQMFQKVITNNLPFISKVVKALGMMVEQFMSIFGFLSKIFGDKGAFMAMMGMARALKTTRGTLVEKNVNTQNMNVKASSVSLMGTLKGAYDGYKVGKLAGPKGAAIGAVAGGVAGGGFLGAGVKEKWDATAGKAASVLSIKSLLGGKAAAAAMPSAAPTAGTAASSLLALRSAGASASTSVAGMGAATDKSSTGLKHFSRALGKATGQLMSLRSGGRTPTTGAPMPVVTPGGGGGGGAPMPVVVPGGGGGNGKGFSRFSRGMARLGGFGKQNLAKTQADKDQKRKPFGGMGGFALAMGLSKLSEKVEDENVSAGLSLAATAAMFSPKMGLGLAAGTLAMNSEDGGLAMLGGAGAGAAIGSEFGGAGKVIGAVIGTIAGFIMAPITAMKKARKEAEGVVDSFFAQTTGQIMVNMALVEAEAKRNGGPVGGETTITASMGAAAQRMGMLRNIAATGAEGGLATKNRGYMETVLGATAIGTGIGAISGGGVLSAPGAGIGAGVGFVSGNIAYFGGKAITGIQGLFGKDMSDRDRERGGAINQLYAAGMLSKSEYERATGKKKNKFLGMDRLAKDDPVDSRYQQALLERIKKQAGAYEEAYKSAEGTVDSRIDVIKSVTGMAETEIVSLAQTMNVNLADATQDFNQQLIKLGVTVVKTAQQLDQAMASMMQDTINNIYDQAIKQQQSPQIINDIMKNFRVDYDQRTDKKITAEDSKLLIGTATEQLTNMYGGDASLAYFETMRQFGSADGLAFQKFNAEGGLNPLGGLGEEFFKGQTGEANTRAFNKMEQGMLDIALPQLGAAMAKSGQGFANADTMGSIRDRVAEMSTSDQERFFNMVSSGNLQQFGGIQGALSEFGMGDLAAGNLKSLTDNEKAFGMATDNLAKEQILLEAQLKVTEDMGKFFGEGADKPEWWSSDSLRQLFIDAGLTDDDTRTPRGKGIGDTTSSRLSQTLSRHASMDSAISGKRMITSAFRTNNLGSMNSDHVTGRAYDLVGNQLGMYKTTVERNGGFAEFHGGSQNRHLHVVPGPGPMGDMSSPVPSYSRGGGGSRSSGGEVMTKEVAVTVNVNGVGIKEAIPQIQAAIQRAMYESNNRS